MRKGFALAVTVALFPLTWQITAAQSRFAQAPTRQNTEMRFRTMDRNNDGVITRGEWTGSAQSFDAHDWNHDGVLSGDEVRVGAPRSTRRITDDDFDATSTQFYNWT